VNSEQFRASFLSYDNNFGESACHGSLTVAGYHEPGVDGWTMLSYAIAKVQVDG